MIANLESSTALPQAAPNQPPSRVQELQQTVSASRLGLWLQCRLKFYFKYVLRLVKPNTPARHVGSVVHAVLQAWNKARWRNQAFAIEGFKAFFEHDWQERQKDAPIVWDGEEAAQRSGAWSLLEMYLAQTPIPANEKPEGVEVRAEADLSSHGLPTLIGILDLVRAGGRIVDFKTAAQTPNEETDIHLHEIQTSAYAVLYREATGHPEAGIELHHLIKTKSPKLVVTSMPPMNQRQEAKLFRGIESYVEGVAREDFVPSPGFHCAGCEFFGPCRLWDARGTDHA